jgi:hypothetical protein
MLIAARYIDLRATGEEEPSPHAGLSFPSTSPERRGSLLLGNLAGRHRFFSARPLFGRLGRLAQSLASFRLASRRAVVGLRNGRQKSASNQNLPTLWPCRGQIDTDAGRLRRIQVSQLNVSHLSRVWHGATAHRQWRRPDHGPFRFPRWPAIPRRMTGF